MSTDLPKIYSLPLFPLHYVLFPQFPLRLHVFEERYKAMIAACIERSEPFGVVLIRAGQEVGPPAIPHDVGCVARIMEVQRLADGQMDLIAAGESRFRLLEYAQADLPYLIGRVEALEDTPESRSALDPQTQALTELFLHYLALLAERAHLPLPEIPLPEDPTQLAFCIASVVQISTQDKQRLLAMTDAGERLEEERVFLQKQVEALEAWQARQKRQQEEGAEPQVLIAEPIDHDKERWRRYRHEGRN